MALQCVCFPVADPRMMVAQKQGSKLDRHCQDPKQMAAAEPLDLCKIVKRTREFEKKKHDDRQCHDKGEKRQNLINKLKMFLDDCDDRPVLKRSDGGAVATGVGQTGYGPLIKYPGYVDYDHPYFSHPYDKLPELATTVGQRGVNPCPPISVRNWDATRGAAAEASALAYGASGAVGRSQKGDADGCCRCAERRKVPPKCPAACKNQNSANRAQAASARPQPNTAPRPQLAGGTVICECTYDAPRAPPTMGALPDGGLQYYCCPLPQD